MQEIWHEGCINRFVTECVWDHKGAWLQSCNFSNFGNQTKLKIVRQTNLNKCCLYAHPLNSNTPQAAHRNWYLETRCSAKPNVSPPGCATGHLRLATPMHYYSYRTLRPSSKCHRNSVFLVKNKNWLSWQRPLRDRKTNFRLIAYSHSSTSPDNLPKIGSPADTEIIGLTKIAKK